MRLRHIAIVFLAVVSSAAWPGGAAAEPPPGGYAEPAPQQPVILTPQAQPPPQPQPQPQPAQSQQEGRGIQYGGYVYVPIWLTDPADVVEMSVGFGILGRIGWEFPGGLAAEIFLGYQANGIEGTGPLGGSVSGTLSNYAFGAGLRYAFLNPSALVPFVGINAQLAVWSGCASDVCRGSDTIPAFGGVLGLIYELSANLGLEGGAMMTASLEGDTFEGVQMWLSPFFGATLYY